MRRKATLALLGAVVVAVVFVGRWMNANKVGGQQPAEPFRIAGNLYYVGANDAAAFLIAGSEGHIVIDGGYPTTAKLIMASIAAGGDDPDIILPLRALVWIGFVGYPPARVDHRFTDGDTIRVGPLALTAHVTGGHTRGCTSWSFVVHDGDRDLDVVSACSLKILGGMRYAEQAADLERSFRVLRSLPADIWVTSHARLWGRYRKFVACRTATDPVAPFIDPEGYRAYIDSAEAAFRAGTVH
jgi:metallo-beta-lactamase class B